MAAHSNGFSGLATAHIIAALSGSFNLRGPSVNPGLTDLVLTTPNVCQINTRLSLGKGRGKRENKRKRRKKKKAGLCLLLLLDFFSFSSLYSSFLLLPFLLICPLLHLCLCLFLNILHLFLTFFSSFLIFPFSYFNYSSSQSSSFLNLASLLLLFNPLISYVSVKHMPALSVFSSSCIDVLFFSLYNTP